MPDGVLLAVAAEIDDLIEHGLLSQQPRYETLAMIVDAALVARDALAALLTESSSQRAADR